MAAMCQYYVVPGLYSAGVLVQSRNRRKESENRHGLAYKGAGRGESTRGKYQQPMACLPGGLVGKSPSRCICTLYASQANLYGLGGLNSPVGKCTNCARYYTRVVGTSEKEREALELVNHSQIRYTYIGYKLLRKSNFCFRNYSRTYFLKYIHVEFRK